MVGKPAAERRIESAIVNRLDEDRRARLDTLLTEMVDGTVGLLFDAQGKAQNGQFTLNGKEVNWRVRRTDGGLLLTVVAARALQGDWVGAPQDGRWCLQVNLREQ